MPQPRSKISLAPEQRALLAEALEAARADPATFPEPSDRRDRLARWIGRLDERAGVPGPADFRVAPADWDALQAALGLLEKALRARGARHFATLRAALGDPAGVDATALADARRDLARLDRVEALLGDLRTRLAHEDERAARRRWILP